MRKNNRKAGKIKGLNALKFMSLTAALAFTLVAFEWKSFENRELIYTSLETEELEIEPILITYPEKKKVKIKKTTKKIREESLNAKEIISNDVLVEDKKVPFEIVLDSIKDVVSEEEWFDEEPIVKPYAFPHEMAVFPGGDQALKEFLAHEIKYPEMASSVGIEGQVNLQFVVTKTGEIKEVKILRGIGGGCEEEAVRALLSSPQWKPGKVDGEPVDSYFNLPVKFGYK